MLMVLLFLLNPFKAEVKEFYKDNQVSCDTVTVYYMHYESRGKLCFYLSTGNIMIEGEKKNKSFTNFGVNDWIIAFITPEWIVLTRGKRTVTIRGI